MQPIDVMPFIGEGFIDDFKESIVNGITEFLTDLLIKGITNCMASIDSLITYTITQTRGDLVGRYVTVSPESFGAAGGSPYSIWNRIKGICDNAVVPIAGYILTIVLLNDLIQMLLRGNSFKEFDESILFKWIVKAGCGITLVNNTYVIASGLFSFGTQVTSSAMGFLTGPTGHFNADLFSTALEKLSINELLILVLPVFFTLIGVCLMIGAIIISMLQRIIESYMYLGVSPIPMATLMNETWSGIGKNWIKSILALSFQGLFIIICIGVFSSVYQETVNRIMGLSITEEMAPSEIQQQLLFSVITLLGFCAALIFTILRSGQISKSIFNAG